MRKKQRRCLKNFISTAGNSVLVCHNLDTSDTGIFNQVITLYTIRRDNSRNFCRMKERRGGKAGENEGECLLCRCRRGCGIMGVRKGLII